MISAGRQLPARWYKGRCRLVLHPANVTWDRSGPVYEVLLQFVSIKNAHSIRL